MVIVGYTLINIVVSLFVGMFRFEIGKKGFKQNIYEKTITFAESAYEILDVSSSDHDIPIEQ